MASTKKDKLFLALIVALSLIYYIFHSLPLERKVIGARFIVGETPGFDLNSSEVIFGRVPPGGGSQRKITLQNDHDFAVEVRARISRNLAGFVSIKSPFIIPPYNSTVATVNLNVPADAAFGNYSGKLMFEIRKK